MGRNADPVIRRFEKDYLPKLKELYEPQLVLVFGSRARGDALEDSDLDLIIVSERFRGMSFLERPVKVLTELDLSMAVDLLCYTPDELERKSKELGTVSAALEEGIRL